MHVKAETANNMLMSFQKIVAQNHNTGRDITSLAKFKYFRNQNCLHTESKGRSNLWTASYHLVANLVY